MPDKHSPLNKLQKNLRRYKQYRLLVMELLFVQAVTFLLLIQNSLSAGDMEKLQTRSASLAGFSIILVTAWWALGIVVAKATAACLFHAAGATEEQALALAKAPASIDTTQSLRETWDNYYLNNRRAIDDINKNFRKIMTEKYRIRAEWIDATGNTDTTPLVSFAALIHSGKKTPEDAAEAINLQLAADGEQGNARIYDFGDAPQESAQESSMGAGVSKAMFGAYARGAHPGKFPAVVLVLLVCSIYGYGGHVFLPTKGWWFFGMGMTVGLCFSTVAWLVQGHLTGRLKVRTTLRPATLALAAIIMAPLIFMLYWGTFSQALGSLVTELTGTDGMQSFYAQKLARRTEYGVKYCLRGEDFQSRAIFFYDDCTLTEAEFTALPDIGKVIVNVRTGPTGVLLKGLPKD